jgi:hypothetical protein
MDNEFDPEAFVRIGQSLVINGEIDKEEEENQLAIQILQQKIKEYEEKQKPKSKGFFANLFTSKKDLLNETLEAERYYYNKMLLDKLLITS